MNFEKIKEIVSNSDFIYESPSFYKLYHNKESDITIKIKKNRARVYYNRINKSDKSDPDNYPCRFANNEVFIKDNWLYYVINKI